MYVCEQNIKFENRRIKTHIVTNRNDNGYCFASKRHKNNKEIQRKKERTKPKKREEEKNVTLDV